MQRTAPLRAIHLYGRNERVRVRYADGSERQVKYKSIQKELAAGECTIVEEAAQHTSA